MRKMFLHKWLLLSVLAIVFTGCTYFIAMNNPPPRDKSFKYYGKLDTLEFKKSTFKPNGFYTIQSDRGGFDVIHFVDNGFVSSYVISDTNTRRDPKFMEKDWDFGYYKLSNDTIFFTTKVFYDYTEHYFIGLIEGDYLLIKYLNKKNNANKGFVRYKYNKTLSESWNK